MNTNRKIVAAAALILAGSGWYAFRPERAFIDQRVSESLPVAAAMQAGDHLDAPTPMELASGSFRSVAHETKGTATVLRLSDGQRVLRLTGFETSNGPDVRVYLLAATDAMDNEAVTSAGFADLGSLKGNVGDQNYEIPATLDLSNYRAVTIWCKRFSVNFGTAPLAIREMTEDAAPPVTVMESVPVAM